MTTLIYNGVILRDCETKSFNQTVEYDPSGTDILISRFRIRVASTLVATSYPSQSFGISPPAEVPGQNVATRMGEITARLNQPRKDFYFMLLQLTTKENEFSLNPNVTHSQSLLTATGDLTTNNGLMFANPIDNDDSTTIQRSTVVDVNNGPRPIDVQITQIIGGRSLRVEFEIEVCRKLCPSNFNDVKPDAAVWGETINEFKNPLNPLQTISAGNVLSNRWSLDESKDENWITTRALEGTLRVAHHSFWPHIFRVLCVPPLLRGYKRVRQSFTDDPTGLVLKYRIEDRQAHAAPPYPAINWSGHHAETASGPNGSILGADFSIRLIGPPDVDKTQLIQAAAKVAVDRIKGLAPEFDEDGNRLDFSAIIRNASIVNILDQPAIEMRVQAQYTGDKATPKSFGLRIREMGKSIALISRPQLDDVEDWAAEQRYALGAVVTYEGEYYMCIVNHVSDEEFSEDIDQVRWQKIDPNDYNVDSYNPKVWPVPLPFDSPTPAGNFACYLQNPCSVWHDVPEGRVPYSSGSTSTDETNARRPYVSSTGDGDYHTSTILHSPHNIPEDQGFLRDLENPPVTDDKYNYLKFAVTFIDIENKYIYTHGWTQMPLANVPTNPLARSASLIKLHGRTCKRQITMTATREGKPPLIPNMQEITTDVNGITEALESITMAIKSPQISSGGRGRTYATQLTYTYLLVRAPYPDQDIADKFMVASLPFDRFLPASQDSAIPNNAVNFYSMMDDGLMTHVGDGWDISVPDGSGSSPA